ncbi:Rtt103p NDAI_0C04010 [Naumovozyma dairenensis CBS 421]|uniref:CID domain-containing protein n=1 Tax=Naumovozyma dairenensis (strain ATCC 10597 / BCRC 20456 / CBS 421 / NBRC 0211 / NRRL Y-12639) TaxID=1071378 RepID=G0W8F0_NAUDC|nr:hypothetical protein NDAI_0C04010 [Naumovozyma dairenensis CBS 421]CCD24061.1 hypothetical protein NDAI_0C04010 [Naumovozyma dairenensis CBS 421]
MSFSTQQFVNKLNNLEDTQESISSAAKWLVSQYREASEVANCWKGYMLKSSINTRRKLLALYLANHVVQQAKSQQITQFQESFGKVSAEAIGSIYSTFPSDLKKKVKRVTNIWKERRIFSPDILKEIDRALEQGSSSTDNVALPPHVKAIADNYIQLDNNKHHIQAVKARFDKSVQELDPSSMVYEENYKTVSKIGQLTKDTITKSLKLREENISKLEKMLEGERKGLEQEKMLLSEVEFSLLSKNPETMRKGTDEEDVLPSYEVDENDNDDNDSEDIEASSDNDDKIKEKEESKETDNVKRTINDSSSELNDESSHDNHKRAKIGENNTSESNSEDVTSQTGTPESGNDIAANAGMTSSIQDLLSRLAN